MEGKSAITPPDMTGWQVSGDIVHALFLAAAGVQVDKITHEYMHFMTTIGLRHESRR